MLSKTADAQLPILLRSPVPLAGPSHQPGGREILYDSVLGSYASYCPELPGCASAGDTEEDALENVREAMALYLEPTPVEIGAEGKVFEVEVPA